MKNETEKLNGGVTKVMESKNHFLFFQEKMLTHSSEIAHDIISLLEERYPEDYRGLADEDKNTRIQIINELVQTIANNLVHRENTPTITKNWGEYIGEEAIKKNLHLPTYLQKISIYKEVIWTFIEEKFKEYDQSSSGMIQVVMQVDYLFNHIIHGFSLAFSKDEKRRMDDYEEKYLKLSTPIVPVKDNVAILPIIGEIDEKRANVLIEETLNEVNQLNIDWIVIDLLGVYNVDDLFMNHLQKLLESIIILGITPILTGIRPEFSMRATQMGLNIIQSKEVLTKPNLKQAIEMLQ
ncbi:STAS domain-containing protein [Pontibacillus sp. HMF3514]|uniref:STAS domain-containing protein n=1 Tax=Pontibacillus sp. HMF3514 TaxID=2692425 RepID=UPI0013201FD2|nr:STAS domain-containing protein [Pontibacillus sp. HMF3514]QHE53894.1 STAS domain-containing protein [Pontibacillus sp. HMF3514]